MDLGALGISDSGSGSIAAFAAQCLTDSGPLEPPGADSLAIDLENRQIDALEDSLGGGLGDELAQAGLEDNQDAESSELPSFGEFELIANHDQSRHEDEQIVELQAKIEELSSALDQARQEISNLQESSESGSQELASKLTAAEQARDELSSKLTASEQARDELSSRLTASEQARDELSSKLDETNRSLDQARQEISNLRESSETGSQELASRLTASEQAREELSSKLTVDRKSTRLNSSHT